MSHLSWFHFFRISPPDSLTEESLSLCAQMESCSEFTRIKEMFQSVLASNAELIKSNSKLVNSNAELKNTVEELKLSNEDLKQRVQTLENGAFETAYPASCQQLAEQGQTENNIYLIQPSIDQEPFYVCLYHLMFV